MGSREEMDTENPKPPSAKWHVHRLVPAADNHVIWVDEINDFIPTIPPNIILGEE